MFGSNVKLPSSGYKSNSPMGKNDKDIGRGNNRINVVMESTGVRRVVKGISKHRLKFTRL
jgi:hypothetical protein